MAKKSFWQRGEDYAKKVSGELIEQIKRGVAPWQKPWKPGEQISAENFSTGKKYTGGNSLYLMSRGIRDGRGDNRWGTYNQIREAGGQVRKGEKGTQVLFFTDRTAKAAKDEKGQTLKDKEGKTIYEEEQRSHPICKQYTVFNVEQADGLELKPREGQVRPEWDAHRDAEKVIEAIRDHRAARRRRSSLLSDCRGQGSAPGAVPIPHPERLLPDGASRVRPLDRPPGSHGPRHAQRRDWTKALDRLSTPAKNCGPRSAP